MKSYGLIRTLLFGLLAAHYASVANAQQAQPVLVDGATQDSSVATPVVVSPFAALQPPKAPKVTCEGNQLTISADNSTLRSILAAVDACIGVQIDLPAGADGNSRTFEELGPGPVRQVLAALLSGSDFNYVISSSDKSPQKVETVLLMGRSSDTQNSPAPDFAASPSRRLSRQYGRSASSSRDAGSLAVEEPAAAPATGVGEAAPIDNSAKNAASDAAVPAAPDVPALPSTTGASSAALSASTAEAAMNAAPSVDPNKDTAARIGDMQQLFEQRRSMTLTHSTSTP